MLEFAPLTTIEFAPLTIIEFAPLTIGLLAQDDDDDEDEDDGCDDKYDNSGDPERLKAFNVSRDKDD